MNYPKVGFIGLGLIGGSIAKNIRRIYKDAKIVAFDNNKESLYTAYNDSIVNYIIEKEADIKQGFFDCDYIFLCTPVKFNDEYVRIIKEFITDKTILTDVGSVKTDIHNCIHNNGLDEYFIGGHPMAGSEKTGYNNSNSYLIENVYYILTTSPNISNKKVAEFEKFIKSLGALTVIIDYNKHDYLTSLISHLPHVIASGLVNYVLSNDPDDLLKTLAAGGFKDITRIASSSPVMWQHICLTNKDNIVKGLDEYIKVLSLIKNSIISEDDKSILDFFENAKNYRDSVHSTKKGTVDCIYEIHCDLIDETGAIANVARLLADNNINIKNIGIIHNREFEEGALHLELYNHSSMENAITLLRQNNYTVYERR